MATMPVAAEAQGDARHTTRVVTAEPRPMVLEHVQR